MYPGGPAVQTFNPAPADGSTHQMHSMPPASNQPYYGLPAQQMSLPPGAPVSGGAIPAGSQMPGYGAGQQAPTMGQPQYHVAPPQGAGGGYQGPAVPGGPTGYQAPTMHTQQVPATQMYMPSSATTQQPASAAEYQPYNMHGNDQLLIHYSHVTHVIVRVRTKTESLSSLKLCIHCEVIINHHTRALLLEAVYLCILLYHLVASDDSQSLV